MKQIDVSTKKHPNKFAIVDDGDYEFLIQWRWHVFKSKRTYYAARTIPHPKVGGKRTLLLMHREILNVPESSQTDHRNHNGLDNRRHNIRACTGDQNRYNQQPLVGRASKYKGVTRHGKKWRARIKYKKQEMHIACFESDVDAAKAYDVKAKELFGGFAYLNFPEQ